MDKKNCKNCNVAIVKLPKYSQKQWEDRKYCSNKCASEDFPHFSSRFSTTYKSWAHMKERCDNRNGSDYTHWGGRGITYDPSWREFKNFLEDMGEKPTNMTLDRIDVNGNYCKENCRWATWRAQQNNRRDNHKITFTGLTLTISEWARHYNMSPTLLRQRIVRDGMSFGDAVKKHSDAKVWYMPKT